VTPPGVVMVDLSVPTGPGAEGWRPLVEHFFEPADVTRALAVMSCESKGDPDAKNPGSTASGLFQHLASQWGPRAEAIGYPDAGVFDPVANVAAAAWLVYDGGGWSHWNASRGCW
jgi:soluble lytic murein transglycosylase-like protein